MLSYNKYLANLNNAKEIDMQLQESGEMYLETILLLTEQSPNVRSIDVVEYMGFSKPSVSRAIGLLKNGGYIVVDENGYISLTDIGRETAIKVYERHKLLTHALVAIGVAEDTASFDACKIEHHISDESFEAIKNHLAKYNLKF
jgi:Mn-dependent DtxR family transcriptional regulator